MNSYLSNNKGNLTLPGILVTILLFTYFIATTYHLKNNYLSLKSRGQTYLCYKYMLSNAKDYIKKIGLFNRAIALIYPLTLHPSTAIKAQTVMTYLKKAQSIIHFLYMSKIPLNSYCKYQQSIHIIRTIPYQTKGKIFSLKRSEGQTVALKNKNWNIRIPEWINNTITLPTFILQGKLSLKNRFTTTAKLKTKELTFSIIKDISY